ncbi:MAG TPA: transglycosylase domain-containing protein, partial [Bacteroidales bacterium]|nr:transglycosylase domain-containing protein [Bacteroidales bacterium]
MQNLFNWKSSKKTFQSFPRKLKNDFRRNWKYLLWAIAALAVVNLALIVALVISINKGFFGPLPDKYQIRNIEHPVASKVFSADSVLMGKYYSQNRLDLQENEVKPELIDALIATEDNRFYNHNGIDVKSLFRVAIKTIMLQKNHSGGGSTISQQLAKNLYPRKEYPFGSLVINKLREMIIAVKLEKYYRKEQILLIYLNTVPFGGNTYGLKSGALRFFHKNPTELKTEETALLVGMLKGTSFYNPRSNYERALNRRNIVLYQMHKYGYISEEVKDSLSSLPIELNYYRFSREKKIAPYYADNVRTQVETLLDNINKKTGSKYNLDTDGLIIYTTIDSRLQNYAEQAVNQHLQKIQKTLDKQWQNTNWQGNSGLWNVIKKNLENTDKDSLNVKIKTTVFDWKTGEKDTILTPVEKAIYNMKLLQAGFIAIENKTGNIKAWVGGINHNLFQFDHVTARRQVGSTFKPFVYLTAFESGYRPCDIFNNQRYQYANFEDWSPRNSDNKYEGMYTMKGALSNSVNTVSATLITEVGVRKVIDMAHRAGIESELPDVPSIALGTAELTLLELVNSYQSFANYGQRRKPIFISKIIDNDGDVIFRTSDIEKSKPDSIAPKENIELLISMLKNVVTNGTAARLRYRYNIYSDVAGKTGTTQNYADGWFVGFTPEYTAGVWVGA